MRIAKKLTILAFLAGAGSLLASCGDNSQSCGPGTEANADGVCTPTGGDGPDAEPGTDPDAEPDPDADTTSTVSGTLAVLDTSLTDASAAAFGSFRGGAIRMSFNDLLDSTRGGTVLFGTSPIQGCLITHYDAAHPPYDRLDSGTITLTGSALLKTLGPCSLAPSLGDPDPYACISNKSPAAGSLVVGSGVGGGAVAYSFPGVDFGMTTPVSIANITRGPFAGLPPNTVQVTTTAAHGYKTGQFVVIAGVSDASFNSPTVSGITVGFPVSVSGANTFLFSQAGAFATVNTSGTASGATNGISGSSLIVNGFTGGPSSPLFNSGTGSFFVISQTGAATVLAINTAATASGNTAGAAVQYTFLNGSSPVPTTGNFLEFHDFLGAGTLNISKGAQAGVWGAINEDIDVPGEAPAAVAITGLSRNNTAFLGLGITTGNLDTVVQAKATGAAGNNTTIQLVADGATVGLLDETGFPAIVFHFQTGVTTVANFETAITASVNLSVRTPDATNTDTFAAGDVLAATNLAHGAEGVTATMTAGHGVTAGQRVTIAGSVPSTAAIALASRSDAGNFVAVTTATPHGLGPNGAVASPFPVTIAGATTVIPNGSYLVVNIISANTFAVFFDNASDVAGTPGGTTTTKSYNGTFTVSFADATTFRYVQDGNDAAAATTPGTARKSPFALDTTPGTGTASQVPDAFPTTTAANTADLNYSCDNNTAAVEDDTCGVSSTSALKAMIISGSATKKSLQGLQRFQMPKEMSGDSEWIEWQCAFLSPNKSATMTMAAVQAIIDFKPTRIEQQVLFVGGNQLSDGVNVSSVNVLAGHALAGHQTFCPYAGTATDANGVALCAACNDGIDNDGDNMIDFPGDGGCANATDATE